MDNGPKTTKRRNFLAKLGAMVFGTALLGTSRGESFASTKNSAPHSPVFSPLMTTEAYIGSIGIFAGNFPPKNWAFCDGQIINIASNTALFSILGTMYGGNGTTNFALPDLRGRVPVIAGQGPGLTNRELGECAGEYCHTLSTFEIPSHNHIQNGSQNIASSANPGALLPAVSSEGALQYASAGAVSLNSSAVGVSGGSQPHNNMQPFLALNFCICLYGLFPPRW